VIPGQPAPPVLKERRVNAVNRAHQLAREERLRSARPVLPVAPAPVAPPAPLALLARPVLPVPESLLKLSRVLWQRYLPGSQHSSPTRRPIYGT